MSLPNQTFHPLPDTYLQITTFGLYKHALILPVPKMCVSGIPQYTLYVWLILLINMFGKVTHLNIVPNNSLFSYIDMGYHVSVQI